MIWLRTVFREVFGLFVDDVSLALPILVWLGLIALLLPHLGWLPIWVFRWRGATLFLGLSAILMYSAIRYARRSGS